MFRDKETFALFPTELTFFGKTFQALESSFITVRTACTKLSAFFFNFFFLYYAALVLTRLLYLEELIRIIRRFGGPILLDSFVNSLLHSIYIFPFSFQNKYFKFIRQAVFLANARSVTVKYARGHQSRFLRREWFFSLCYNSYSYLFLGAAVKRTG